MTRVKLVLATQAVAALCLVFVPASSHAAVWVVNGAKLGAGAEVGYVLKPIEPFDIFYTEGVNLYEVVCSTAPINDNVGKLIGGKPGKDSLNKFAIATKTCDVQKTGKPEPKCEVRDTVPVKAPSSVLEEEKGIFLDKFEKLEIKFEVSAKEKETCPTAKGLLTLSGSFQGLWDNPTSTLQFSAVDVTYGGKEVELDAEYVFRVRGGLKVDKTKWEVDGKLLEAGAEHEALYEGSGFKLKSAGMTIECEAADASGELKGGAPGTGTATLDLGGCAVVGVSPCTVENLIQTSTTKSTLVTLSEEKKEYGDKLEELKGTVGFSGGECPLSGNSTPLKGSLVGRANASTEELEFTEPAQTGSTLTLGLSSATLVGNAKMSAADPVEVLKE